MTPRRLMLFMGAVLLLCSDGTVYTQRNGDGLSLNVLFFDALRSGADTRMWLQIKNSTPRVQVLCRPYWGYTWISPDPQGDAAVEANTSLHGCGDDDHDGFWLLLPGESRFDSFEIKSPPTPTATLAVEVEVIERVLGATEPSARRTMSWKGRVSDAVALGDRLRAGFKKPL